MNCNINIFTIRKIDTKELIYACGVPHDEMELNFKLTKDNFSEEELLNEITTESAWEVDYKGLYSFNEEIRHLVNYTYDKIEFNIEEVLMVDVNIDEKS